MNSMYHQLMRLPLFQGVSTEKITLLVEKLRFISSSSATVSRS